jgi:hypothetical protein
MVCSGGQLEMVKYLCEKGGKALLMKADIVSVMASWTLMLMLTLTLTLIAHAHAHAQAHTI